MGESSKGLRTRKFHTKDSDKKKSFKSESSSSFPKSTPSTTSKKILRSIFPDDPSYWVPSLRTAFSAFALIRLFSSIFNHITDCDETYNYWEPMHYIFQGYGFQTWEYSPIYALRSYTYLVFHGLLGHLSTWILYGGTKIGIFYGLRTSLGFLCAYTEAYFYRGIVERIGKEVGLWTGFFLLFSAGMFHSSTSFLPSTFSMYCLMFVYGSWLKKKYSWGIFVGILSVLIGWPYVAVLYIPFAFNVFYTRGFFRSIIFGAACLKVILISEIFINFHFYRQWTLPAWNIFKYNVLDVDEHGGSTLYGTEPLSFYLSNLILNFNIVWIFAIFGILFSMLSLFLPLHPKQNQTQEYIEGIYYLSMYLFPLYLWCFIMFTQAHKEERFLYPIYPLICLSGGLTCYFFNLFIPYLLKQCFLSKPSKWKLKLCLLGWKGSRFFLICLFFFFSITRITNLILNYQAPLQIFHYIATNETFQSTSNRICIGKEWYRFPTSFFFTSNQTSLHFLRSSFRGQLPKPFESINGTSIIPTNMNNENKEEMSRYVPLSSCDYVVDLILPSKQIHINPSNPSDLDPLEEITEDENPSKIQQNHVNEFVPTKEDWELIVSYPFLDSSSSSSFYRAFYIPFISKKHIKYAPYALYKRIHLANI